MLFRSFICFDGSDFFAAAVSSAALLLFSFGDNGDEGFVSDATTAASSDSELFMDEAKKRNRRWLARLLQLVNDGSSDLLVLAT